MDFNMGEGVMQKDFKLKGTLPISCHLGCDFGRDDDGLHFAPKTTLRKWLNAAATFLVLNSISNSHNLCKREKILNQMLLRIQIQMMFRNICQLQVQFNGLSPQEDSTSKPQSRLQTLLELSLGKVILIFVREFCRVQPSLNGILSELRLKNLIFHLFQLYHVIGRNHFIEKLRSLFLKMCLHHQEIMQ